MSVKPIRNPEISTSFSSMNKKDWASVVQNRNIYLSIPYLEALESNLNDSIDIFYSLAYSNSGKPALVAVFQLVSLEYRSSIHPQAFLKHFYKEKNEEGRISMNILVCGNVFSDGENGFLWTDEFSEEMAIKQVVEIAKCIKNDKTKRKKLSVLLFKEFWPRSEGYSELLKDYNYKDFMIDVNMVLPIHESWKSMNDYLFSMKTKFRTKAKSVFKKSESLTIRSLNYEEIFDRKNRIQELFNNVLDRSNYSFGKIDTCVFSAFKKNLDSEFSFRGVFFEDQFIGFSTAFFHNNIMEANYVGIDYDHNIEYGVYQRLLYDYVEQAIISDAKELQLGRTSELIKSSLGAHPINMKLYAKHKTVLTHILMSAILNFVSPSKFELRKPFKTNFKNS